MTDRPGYGADRIVRGLALPRRVAHVLAGLGGLSTAVLIGTLWATEPDELPVRTQVAFAAMILTGVAWAVVAAVALARRPLFAIDRVVAAWLAVASTVLLTVGMVTITLSRASTTGTVAAAGLGLIVAAVALLVRARAYRAALMARLRELEAPANSVPPNRHSRAATGQPNSRGVTPMTTRKPAPIGPLALALRHLRSPSGGRHLTALAVVLGVALLAGIAVLLTR